MNKVIVAPKAQGDLLEIRDYISDELQNTAAAKKAVAKITKKIRILQEHALMGAPLASVSDANSDERFLVSGSYLIFYHVNGSDVFIDRVLYGRRDYLRVLFGDSIKEETDVSCREAPLCGASFRSPICHTPYFVLQ